MSRCKPRRSMARCGADFSRGLSGGFCWGWALAASGMGALSPPRNGTIPVRIESSGRYSLQAMPQPNTYTLADFDFELPPELIAQHPAAERSASLLLDGTDELPVDRVFRDL